MGAKSKIEWTDHTFNPWWGCTRVSPGCEHCYAETFSKRLGLRVWGPTAERRFFGAKHWAEPHRWNAAAERAGVRRRVFCASMADVCEDVNEPRVQSLLNGARRELARLIEQTPALDWLLLTKRIENFRTALPPELFTGHEYPRNIWPGTTAEDQRRFDERVPHLVDLWEFPVRFISAEPLLGPVELYRSLRRECTTCHATALPGEDRCYVQYPFVCGGTVRPALDWVIVGGESGPGARPFNVSWARSIVKQCKAARVPVFVKQLGRDVRDRNDAGFLGEEPHHWPERIDIRDRVEHDLGGTRDGYQGAPVRIHLDDRKGGEPSEWPEDLRVRQFPEVRACA